VFGGGESEAGEYGCGSEGYIRDLRVALLGLLRFGYPVEHLLELIKEHDVRIHKERQSTV
jgi:hypothetical protein